MACHELGWWPAQAHAEQRRLHYLWRLTHVAPPKVRRVHSIVAAPDALDRSAPGSRSSRRSTAPWMQLTHPDAQAVDASLANASYPAWKAAVLQMLTAKYAEHWTALLREEVCKHKAPTPPARFIGKHMHKPLRELEGRLDEPWDTRMGTGTIADYDAQRRLFRVVYPRDDPALCVSRATCHHPRLPPRETRAPTTPSR